MQRWKSAENASPNRQHASAPRNSQKNELIRTHVVWKTSIVNKVNDLLCDFLSCIHFENEFHRINAIGCRFTRLFCLNECLRYAKIAKNRFGRAGKTVKKLQKQYKGFLTSTFVHNNTIYMRCRLIIKKHVFTRSRTRPIPAESSTRHVFAIGNY